MFEERAEEMVFEVGHVVVLAPPFFDYSQRRTIREAGALTGVNVCRICSKQKPVIKPRGCPGEEPLRRAESNPQGESCGGSSEPASEPMLRAAYCLLQMAHLLLQSGQQAKEVESEGAKEKINRVNVACQTEHKKEEPEDSAEPEETAFSEASRGVALLKAKLEEEMEH